MMTKAYNIIDYQLDRESSKYHQSVIKKINDDNKDNRINIEEYSIKGSMFIINQINLSLILINICDIFSNFFSPTANSDASTNRTRPMEAEAINTPSTTLAQMKPMICEREEKQIMMMQNSELPSHQQTRQNL
jgi:hypothetical protein